MIFASSQSIASAKANSGSAPIVNHTQQIKSIVIHKKAILQYMDKKANKILLLVTQDSRKDYYQNYLEIRKDISNYFDAINKNPAWYTLPEVKTSLRTKVATFTEWQKEVERTIATNQNPFTLTPDEITTVESDLISMQKDLIGIIRSYIDELSTLDIKKSTNGTYRAEFKDNQWAELTISQSFSISSFLQNKSEFDLTAKIAVDTKEDVSWDTDEKMHITGNASIDGNAKLIDGKELYVTIRGGDLNLSAILLDASGAIESTGSSYANSAKKSFEDQLALGKETLSKVIGKTIHISLPNNSSELAGMKPSDVLKNVNAVLVILESNSLLTPFKKLDNTYSLIVKKDTIQKIGDVFGDTPSDEDVASINTDMKKTPILYKNDSNGNSELYFDIQESEITGRTSLARNGGLYTFSEHMSSTSKYNPFTLDLTIKRDSVVGSFSAPRNQVAITTNWINNQLDIKAQYADNALTITGPLSKETTNLSFQYNKKEFASYQQALANNIYTYTLNVTINPKDFDASAESSPIKFTAKGNATIEKGSFPIVTPNNSVEFSSLNIGNSSSSEQE
jgi:hypothetical protein